MTDWNSTLTRKTALKPGTKGLRKTGFKPKPNGSPRWNGAMGPAVKPKKRKAKKKKPWDNPEFKRDYMEENKTCELLPHMPKAGLGRCRVPTGIHEKYCSPISIVQKSTDPHHCLWGLARRWDIRACLVAACEVAHTFCHQYPNEGRILSLWVKRQKGELDWSELDRIYRGKSFREDMSYQQYISKNPPRFEWMMEMWLTLIECPEVP